MHHTVPFGQSDNKRADDIVVFCLISSYTCCANFNSSKSNLMSVGPNV